MSEEIIEELEKLEATLTVLLVELRRINLCLEHAIDTSVTKFVAGE